MNRSTSTLIVGGLVLSLLASAGCAKNRRGNRPKTYPVRGVVTLRGEPLAGATVMFNPVAEGGSGAIALTDQSGVYKLTTFESGDGAVAGDYRVAVTKTVFVPIKDPTSDASGTVVTDPKNQLPLKYADSATSGFAATVAEGPENTFDFALEK